MKEAIIKLIPIEINISQKSLFSASYNLPIYIACFLVSSIEIPNFSVEFLLPVLKTL
jgi:hypothetical protein